MKALYVGRYVEPSVNFRGVPFIEGQSSDVTEEWFNKNQSDRVIAAPIDSPKRKKTVKPKVKPSDYSD